MASMDRLARRTAAQAAQAAQAPPAARTTLAAALLGFFMISLDATAVNVALPAIGRTLGGTTAGLQWAVDGYTLPFAALLISAGAVSDRAGARRVYGSGLAVFVAASAACGLAPQLALLIAARVVQGGAAAVMLPASLALVRQAFADPARRARGVALWSAGAATAIAAGPVIGGVLTSAVDWRVIFFVNLPAGLAALALLTRTARSPRRSAPLDVPGQLTVIAALAALAFGVIEGGAAGFGRPVVAGALVVAAAGFAAFVVIEAAAAHPMVPLRLLRSGVVAACVGIGFSINVAFYGIAFVLSLYFQRVLGEPAITAGLMFLPMTALLTVANLASARVAARFGHHAPVRAGITVSALAMLALAFLHGRLSMALDLVPVGTGLGFALPSLTFVLLEAIPADQAGLAGGLLNAGRQTGGALAVALYGALLSGSFLGGMRASILISAALLAASSAAAITLLRPNRA
jgi:DHA2 family methylenomycin A resistance protein-like MFS transporter